MNGTALVALSCCVAALMAVAGGYLARVTVPRPPVGVYAPADVAVLCAGVVVAPLLYGALPGAWVSALFGLVLCVAVQFTLAPLCSGRWAWCLALAATGLTAGAAVAGTAAGVRAGTGVLLAVAVVGVANLWAQSGMRSAQVAALAAVLTCYDLVATTLTHVTGDFFEQVRGRPFAPLLALTGGAHPVAVGLGDLLLLVLFPLVAAKAYGRGEALLAGAVGVAVTSAISALFAVGALTEGFPLLTALGPLIVVQHLVWSHRAGGERTTAEWRAGAVAPAPRPGALGPDARLTAAVALTATGLTAAAEGLTATDDGTAAGDGELTATGGGPATALGGGPGITSGGPGAADEGVTATASGPGAGDGGLTAIGPVLEGSWVVLRDGRVVGAGASPGLARRDARERGEEAGPLVARLL
ncbi:hypothetical protein ABZ719_10815 [Streptomyces sp. NPDC006743]|uniref:hypothetical protein n=1 Tax=Streptomyces sp. NPDC006743 TaxID=3154480 RepID=UPI003452A123